MLLSPRSPVDGDDAVSALGLSWAARLGAGSRPAVEALLTSLVRASGGGHAPELDEVAHAVGRRAGTVGLGVLDLVEQLLALRGPLATTARAEGLEPDPVALDRAVRACLAGAVDAPGALRLTRDRVTGFLLPDVLTEVLVCEVDAAPRYGQPTLLVVHAPTVGEQAALRGRLAGDLVMLRLAAALRRTARRSDVLGTLEHADGLLACALLPRTDALHAQAVVRRLLARLSVMDPEVRRSPAVVTGLGGGRRGTFTVGVGHVPAAATAAEVVDDAFAALSRLRSSPPA